MQNIAFSLFLSHYLLFSACEPNPCLNGGSCQLDIDSPDGFVCKCPPKFSGSKCESKAYSVLLIKYHMPCRILSEADENLRSASFRNNSMIHFFFSFFSNTVNEEAESQSTPGKNELNLHGLIKFLHTLSLWSLKLFSG